MKNTIQLAKQRSELFRKASKFEKIPRIPLFSMFSTWKILDAGFSLTQAMSDYEIMEKVVRYHQQEYKFDAISDVGNRNAYLVAKALGESKYIFDDKTGNINYTGFHFCEHNEIIELANDFNKFIWEKAMSRKYSFWNDAVDIDQLNNAVKAMEDYKSYIIRMRKMLYHEYGVPEFTSPLPAPRLPMEDIFNYIRGIQGLSLDMRKSPTKLQILIDKLAEMKYNPCIEYLAENDIKPDTEYCFDLSLTLLFHNLLSIQQWEKYGFRYLKPIIDIAVEKNLSFHINFQGSMMRFLDYFRDYPKGIITLQTENDDLFMIRKKLPNVALMGGIKNSILGSGTKKECIDHAKELLETLSADGGYIMTQNKIGSFWTDAKPANLKAVNNFVLNYKL